MHHEQLFLNSENLKNLNVLRANRGTSLDAHFRHQRRLSDNPDPELQQIWFRNMREVMGELDQVLRCIPGSYPLHFLDLGCCPGGFSSYILSKNFMATGVGVSLGVEDGGHPYLLEEHLRPRMKLKLADLNSFQLGSYVLPDPRLQPFPFQDGDRLFDLASLDGHALRTSTTAIARSSGCLIISQLIICLQTLSLSGTIIMKLSRPEDLVTAKLLYLLDIISLELFTWKPVFIHATRNAFYAVAKGVGCGRQGARCSDILTSLRALWIDLRYGHGDMHRALKPDDLDFIVTTAVLKKTYRLRLQQLSNHIWQVQKQSLEGWYNASGSY